MIYLTGDTHGGESMLKLMPAVLESKGLHLTDKDYLIITGDFGFPFFPSDYADYPVRTKENTDYLDWMKWWNKQPYTTLFIDGNHDNFDFWNSQPVTEMFGGKVHVHPHAKRIIHLMRGEIYTIENKSFFTFGGALSIDKWHRTENVSWWKEEQATFAETEYALDNLAKYNNREYNQNKKGVGHIRLP